MKADLHMHPLCHEYYNGWTLPHGVKELTSIDKERIRAMIDWNVQRGLDICAITDHDMVLSSLYAVEYAKDNKLPIKVLTGTEIELHSNGERVHLCAWGIKEQPKYFHGTPVPELVDQIHEMGGIIIMNHPMFSPHAFVNNYKLLDGYEYINSDAYVFTEGRLFLQAQKYSLKEYRNSDFHYDALRNNFPRDPKYYPKHINDLDASWLDQFKEI